MAFNWNTIKSLFNKLASLAPIADDAVGAVAKYGDDVARVADKVDDVVPTLQSLDPLIPELSEARGSFAPPATVKNPGAQLVAKERILDRRSGLEDVYNHIMSNSGIPHSVPEPIIDDSLSEFRRASHFNLPTTTDWLGDVTYDDRTGGYTPFFGASATPIDRTSVSDLVFQRANHLEPYGRPSGGLRPHKNTRLGKWFAENHPEWDWNSNIFEWIPF